MSEWQPAEKSFENLFHGDITSTDAENDLPAVTLDGDEKLIRSRSNFKGDTTDLESVGPVQVAAASRESSGFSVSKSFMFEMKSILIEHYH